MSNSTVNTNNNLEEVVVRTPELRRNLIYIAYFLQVRREYHRGILVTCSSDIDGILFHSKYAKDIDIWSWERREVRNVTALRSLAVLYRIASISPGNGNVDSWFEKIDEVLTTINMDRDRVRGDDLVDKLVAASQSGYSCIIWLIDAVRGIVARGLVEPRDFEGFSVEEELMAGRLFAGPAQKNLILASALSTRTKNANILFIYTYIYLGEYPTKNQVNSTLGLHEKTPHIQSKFYNCRSASHVRVSCVKQLKTGDNLAG